MLTVPPSVYSASAGYTTAEQAAWREVARAGTDPKPPTVPVSPSTGWGITAGIQALWLGGMAVVQNLGTIGTVFGVSPDQLTSRYEEQGLTAAEGLQCESLEGDFLGDFFTGVNDWFQSLFGVDCAAMRDGELEKNPLWDPLEVIDPAVTSYPATFGGVTFYPALWSSQQLNFGGTSPQNRVEGWIMPMSGTFNASAFPQWRAALVDEDGFHDESSVNSGFTGTIPSNGKSRNTALCPEYANFGCYIVDSMVTGTTGLEVSPGVPYSWTNSAHWGFGGSLKQMRVIGGSYVPMEPIPYVSPALGGAGYQPQGTEVVFLTTVETADGNTYQCRTAPFLESDVNVPTPCDPVIPSGQWEVQRTVEMIPASTPNTSWVVGSDPRRVMSDQQTPAEFQQWREDFPDCSSKVCKLDLVKVGVGSCFALAETCDGWMSDPNRASNYTCTYNGQQTAMSECEAAYPNVFSQTARDLGQAYPQPNDPATGQPSTGGQTSTVAGPVTAPGSAVLPPNQPRNCFPTGWNAFNPFQWVYQPVRCVLEWAFVPRAEYVDQQARTMSLKWTGSSLVGLLAVLEDGTDLVLGGTGCAGPAVNLNIMGGGYSGYPLSACASPMSEVASFSRWFTFAAAWVMAVGSIARSVGGVVGFTKLGGE